MNGRSTTQGSGADAEMGSPLGQRGIGRCAPPHLFAGIWDGSGQQSRLLGIGENKRTHQVNRGSMLLCRMRRISTPESTLCIQNDVFCVLHPAKAWANLFKFLAKFRVVGQELQAVFDPVGVANGLGLPPRFSMCS